MDLDEQLARVPFRALEKAPPLPPVPPRASGWPSLAELSIPILLFLLTLGTTTMANGPAYGACVMGILLCHEMGHYLMCRRHAVPSTLPYFIPLPPVIPGIGAVSILGTLGAVIKMRLRTGDRRVLYDIGIAGPLAGLIVAIPVSLIGLRLSTILPGAGETSGLMLGESLIFKLMERLVLGVVRPDDVVILHPIALAGWTGLFVTGLNLIPVGMLDGGHVVYGLFGRRALYINIAALAGLAYLAVFQFPGWFLWLGLLIVLGFRHPASRLSSGRLDGRRVVLGLVTLALFVLCFVPTPFELK